MLVPRDNHLDQAWQIVFDLLHGGLELADIERQLAGAADRALQARTQSLIDQFSHRSDEENIAALRSLFSSLADAQPGADFGDFRQRLEQEITGIVVTAHPTFAYSQWASEDLIGRVASAMDGVRKRPPANGDTAGQRLHRTQAPTLHEEMDASVAAVRNIRGALRTALRVAVDVAAERFPDRYRELNLNFMTVATWVGFDIDGRRDIDWTTSLSCRFALAVAGLDELRAALVTARERQSPADDAAEEGLAAIDEGSASLRELFASGLGLLENKTPNGIDLAQMNRLAVEQRDAKRKAIDTIDRAFETLSAQALPDALAREIVVLRAEWTSLGIGLGRLHFRLNSVQLDNAIRPELAMLKAPRSSASRRQYLSAISKLVDTVTPVKVHYGTLARERTTAKRLFMLAAQFKKHFDERTPVRLLIAESDAPFTLLVALYYAKLFGVEDYVEISPLFETADGLHHGDRVISEVLDHPGFLEYVRARGRFCLQLGFSDSGRYIGQPAASLAIERFKLRLVRLWAERGLQDIQLVFFDTFGESIGRGAHPDTLTDRFLYTHSEEVRVSLDRLGTAHKHEVSFQGGDGYLWFASHSSALAVVTDLLAVRLRPIEHEEDPLYIRSGWALDFFLTLQDYQRQLTQHPGYLELITSMGRSLLYPSGSRPQKRQSGSGQPASIDSIADLRAIPNNAVLQQLAYLANSCAGVGHASQQATDNFLDVLSRSRRLKRILALVRTARERSDITVMEAYAELTSAGYWLDRSNSSLDREWNIRLRSVSRVMDDVFNQWQIAHFVRTLNIDAALLDDVLDERHVRGSWSSADALTRLHVMRLALIQFICIKALEIPRFSRRLEISLADLVERLVRLDVPDTVQMLREIFPVAVETDGASDYGEQDTYADTSPTGYAAEHREIFDPIEKAYALMLEISALISLHLGAYG